MSAWRPDGLTPACRRGLRWLSGRPWQRPFYLAGGSALALRIGHRLSVDLDFFSLDNPLGDPQRQQILSDLQASADWKPIEESKGFIRGELFSVSASWFAYPVPLLGSTNSWEGIRIAGLLDIGAMKLAAIAQRGLRRDFVDLWFLCQKITLKDFLAAASKKFGSGKDFELILLRALSYFEDAEAQAMLRTKPTVKWETIRSFFESEVRRLTLPSLSS